MKIKISLLLFITITLSVACGNKKRQGGLDIKMGDKQSIVTEKDSSKLENYVADISEGKQAEDDIAKMMVQVDSLKTIQQLEENIDSNKKVSGFKIEFKECTLTFDGLGAKEITAQDPMNSRSVSYVVTKGSLEAMRIDIKGLKNIEITERFFTKLKVAYNEEEYLLSSLGRKISGWFNLAGKDNIFISAGSNSFQFNNLTNQKIKLALDKKLREKEIEEKNIAQWMNRIKNTNNYTDAPCKIYVSTAQFRVKGNTESGQKVNKLIQFDLVE